MVESRDRRTRWGSFVFLFAILVLTDQVIKNWTADVYRNYHFAFGLQVPKNIMFGIYFFLLGAIGFYFAKNFFKFSWQTFFAWTWIVSGAISNVGERIHFGYVRDWLYVLNGVFNLADVYILLGVAMLFAGYKKTDS